MKTISLVIIAVLFSFSSYSQLFKGKVNQFNDEGKKHGKWIEYWESSHVNVYGKGKFNHGVEKGKWKYYHLNGNKRLIFKYYQDKVRVKYFYSSGKPESKGWAKYEITEEEIQYFWHGLWKFYDTDRKLVKISVWENGEEAEIQWQKDISKAPGQETPNNGGVR